MGGMLEFSFFGWDGVAWMAFAGGWMGWLAAYGRSWVAVNWTLVSHCLLTYCPLIAWLWCRSLEFSSLRIPPFLSENMHIFPLRCGGVVGMNLLLFLWPGLTFYCLLNTSFEAGVWLGDLLA